MLVKQKRNKKKRNIQRKKRKKKDALASSLVVVGRTRLCLSVKVVTWRVGVGWCWLLDEMITVKFN
jgi:hypothetical protein